MATLLEDAARRTSVFQLSLFVAVLAVMPPTAKTFGQEDHQQQIVQEQQQEGQKTQKQHQETSRATAKKGSASPEAGVAPATSEAATGQPEQIFHEKSPVSA